jgi:hypothetical protein
VGVSRSSFRWAAVGEAVGAEADSAAVAALVAAAVSVALVVEAGSAAVALADPGEPWRE